MDKHQIVCQFARLWTAFVAFEQFSHFKKSFPIPTITTTWKSMLSQHLRLHQRWRLVLVPVEAAEGVCPPPPQSRPAPRSASVLCIKVWATENREKLSWKGRGRCWGLNPCVYRKFSGSARPGTCIVCFGLKCGTATEFNLSFSFDFSTKKTKKKFQKDPVVRKWV